jgi:hypothetical protein
MIDVSSKRLTSKFLASWIKGNQAGRLSVFIRPPRHFFQGIRVWSARQGQRVNSKLPLWDGMYGQLPDAGVVEVSVADLHEPL